MIREITPENRTAILQLMRSGIVCLDIMRPKVINNNLEELLLDPKFTTFRTEFLLSLDVPTALLFLKHLAMYKSLPVEIRDMTGDLLDALHRCEEPFLLQLSDLLEDEEEITRFATANLLQIIIDDIEEYTVENCQTCSGYGYGGYGYGCYGYGYGGYGYGYSGYGYGGYGYRAYGYYGYGGCEGNNKENQMAYVKDDFSDLHDEQLLELYQAFSHGIENAQHQKVAFIPGQRFTEAEGRAIIFRMQECIGTKHEKMFRAAAHVAMQNPQILPKLKITPK